METNIRVAFCDGANREVIQLRDSDALGCEDEWLCCHNHDDYDNDAPDLDAADVAQFNVNGPANATFQNPFLKRVQRERPDYDIAGM